MRLLMPRDGRALDNVNTPEEYRLALEALDTPAAAAIPPRAVRIQYFALLREQAGRSEETVQTEAATPADLFSELTARYGFTLTRDQLKVAVNSEFADWSRRLCAGDAVVFIPPVAGG
jgi:molybdopterin converting factor subunit 1